MKHRLAHAVLLVFMSGFACGEAVAQATRAMKAFPATHPAITPATSVPTAADPPAKKPAWEYRYKLRPPGAIIAGQDKTFTVDISVRNNTKETIHLIHFTTRIWQDQSPNDVTKESDVLDLEGGKVKTFSVSVTFYNYQAIGATSTPKVKVTAERIDDDSSGKR